MQTAPLDVSRHLDDEEVLAERLTAAAADENPDAFMTALGEVAKARGMYLIAQTTGLGRASLYKALAPGANPGFKTILAVLRALNVDLRIAKKAAPAPVLAKLVAKKRKEDATQKFKRRRKAGKLVVFEPPDR